MPAYQDARAGHVPVQRLGHLENDRARLFLQGVQAVDLRARLLAIEAMGEGAVDEYTLFRDIWLQRRNYQINETSQQRKAKQPDADLPPYLLDDAQDPPAQDASSQDAKPAGD